MKKLLLSLLLCFSLTSLLYAQNYCQTLLQKAQKAFDQNKLEDAFSLLQDTDNCDYENALNERCQKLQDKIFSRVQAQRTMAIQEKERAESLARLVFRSESDEAAWAFGNNGKFAVVDRSGNVLGDGYVWEEPQNYKGGTAIARRFGDYWVLNTQGNPISEGLDWWHPTNIPFQFGIHSGTSFLLDKEDGSSIGAVKPIRWQVQEKNDTANFFPFFKKGRWGLFSTQGEALIKAEHEKIIYDKSVKKLILSNRANAKMGLYSSSFKSIGKSIYDKIYKFSKGRARFKRKGQWGFLDLQGNEIIQAAYDSVCSFQDQRARVWQDSLWGLIDLDGVSLIEPQYNGIVRISANLYRVKKDGMWGLVDSTGTLLAEPFFTEISETLPNMHQIKVGDKWGLIDSSGVLVLEPQYATIKTTSNKYAWFQKRR